MMEKNGEVLDGKQFLAVVKQAYKDSKMPSITQWAGKLGVSYQFLSHVLRGDYNPGPAIAKALGYEQVYGFRRKTVFNSADIRTAVAARAAKNVNPMDGKAIAIAAGDLKEAHKRAASSTGRHRFTRNGASRRATKAAAAHRNRHHGKKTQSKKK